MVRSPRLPANGLFGHWPNSRADSNGAGNRLDTGASMGSAHWLPLAVTKSSAFHAKGLRAAKYGLRRAGQIKRIALINTGLLCSFFLANALIVTFGATSPLLSINLVSLVEQSLPSKIGLTAAMRPQLSCNGHFELVVRGLYSRV